MRKLILIYLGIFSVTLVSAQLDPNSASKSRYTPPAAKAVPDDSIIIREYSLADYSSLEMSETRATREIGASQERITIAKNKISAARGYGGNEVIARANAEIKEAEYTDQKARKALSIIKTKKEEWAAIKQQPLVEIKNAKGLSLQGYIISITPPNFRISTADGRVFNLNASQLAPETVTELNNYEIEKAPVLNSNEQITLSKKSPIAIPLAGISLGLPIAEAARQLKDNKQFGIKIDLLRNDEKNHLTVYQMNYAPLETGTPENQQNGGSIYVSSKTNMIVAISLTGDFADALFNTHNLPLKAFAQKFIDTYAIPELKPVFNRGKSSLYYKSTYDWAMYINRDKGVDIFQSLGR